MKYSPGDIAIAVMLSTLGFFLAAYPLDLPWTMKYSLRIIDKFLLGASLIAGTAFLGLLSAGALVISVMLGLEELNSHPLKAIVSSATMLGIGVVILFVARFMWRETWKTFTADTEMELPSWGAPPPLPNSSAPAPNPPHASATHSGP